MQKCFISYSHKDAQIAIAIQNILENNGIRCWIDFRDATPGVDYAASIVHAIKESNFFILVLSKNSISSLHVLNEVNSAANAGAIIIPFKVDESELNESMEYYIGRTHWMDALTPPLEEHINALIQRIQSMDSAPASASPIKVSGSASKNDCRMLKYHDLIQLGYTSASISIQLVENDYINCNGIGTENEGTAQQWEEFLETSNDTFQYLVNGENKIVGDWSITALDNETFEQAVRGELLEESLDLNSTEMICFPGSYNGYILVFSILPQYRTTKNYNLIIDSFLAQLEEYAENGIFFKRWCINVFGKEVEALAKQLGFKYLTDNKVFGKIYYCDFCPIPQMPVYKSHKRLVELYEHAEL